MGSLITLGINQLEIDWGKNQHFKNHSKLFLESDISDANYYYADKIIDKKPAFVRSLKSIKKRLNLLGYSIERCKKLYENSITELPDYYPETTITFDELHHILTNVDVKKFRFCDDVEDFDFGKFVEKNIFKNPEFSKISEKLKCLTSYEGHFFENIDPYLLLRLLAENPANLSEEIIWRIHDVIESGWVEQKYIHEQLSQSDKILIVTEGSSDSKIIEKALSALHPDVIDFFQFIDMNDNYPFTGTGNVLRFCQGLAQIGILNRTLIILDSDTAGISTYKKICDLKLPSNMLAITLPKIELGCSFKTIGPSGQSQEDINGKAVSIEMFLDLNIGQQIEPIVRWTSFDSSLNAYQGELISKEKYTRYFFSNFDTNPNYEKSRLYLLLDFILKSSEKI